MATTTRVSDAGFASPKEFNAVLIEGNISVLGECTIALFKA